MMHKAIAGGFTALLLAGAAPDRGSDRRETNGEALAAPHLIMVYGGGLERPALLSDWHENHRFMMGLRERDSATLQPVEQAMASRGVISMDTVGRTSMNVALFWLVANELRARQVPMDQWRPADAEQHARFFPATDKDAALWVDVILPRGTAVGMRRLSSAGLAILSSHGVPVSTR